MVMLAQGIRERDPGGSQLSKKKVCCGYPTTAGFPPLALRQPSVQRDDYDGAARSAPCATRSTPVSLAPCPVRDAGFLMKQLRDAGFSLGQLRAASFSAKDANFSK